MGSKTGEQMTLEIRRLHLASLQGLDGSRWPVHGFVVTHPGGAVLVDTGVGGPPDVVDDWRVVNVSVADALAGLDMSPADIDLVINTHLHFDHCGQNAVFRHAPFYVQRSELDRMRREAGELHEWFGFMDARFELLDGDTEVLPGLEVIATPGHTVGHQCVVVRRPGAGPDDGAFDLLIGDAAYNPGIYADPMGKLPPGQAADVGAWRDSVRRIRSLIPERVHFCHHTDIVHR
jgi:N-acyl homoserine lactone hydrolase